MDTGVGDPEGRGGGAGAVSGARGCLAAVVGAAAGLLTWLRTLDRGDFVGFEGEGQDFSQLWVGLPLMVLGAVAAAVVIGAVASRSVRGVGSRSVRGVVVAAGVVVGLGLLVWAVVAVDAWHDERSRPVRLLERGVGAAGPAELFPYPPLPEPGAPPQTPVFKRRTG